MTAFARLLPVLFLSFLLAAPVAVAKPSAPDPMDASLWEIGPITPTRNYSVNMPLTPSPHADAGISTSRSRTPSPAMFIT